MSVVSAGRRQPRAQGRASPGSGALSWRPVPVPVPVAVEVAQHETSIKTDNSFVVHPACVVHRHNGSHTCVCPNGYTSGDKLKSPAAWEARACVPCCSTCKSGGVKACNSDCCDCGQGDCCPNVGGSGGCNSGARWTCCGYCSATC